MMRTRYFNCLSPVITMSLPSLRATSKWLSSRVKNMHVIGALRRIVCIVLKLCMRQITSLLFRFSKNGQ